MKIVAALAIVLVAFACGDDEASCEDAGEAICAKACSCGGSECAIGTAGGGGSLTWPSRGDCEAFYVGLGCAGGSIDVDFETCVSDVEAAACVTFLDQTSGFEPPASCESEQS